MLDDQQPPYTQFPPQELMEEVIDLYFTWSNAFIPLLHRPTIYNGIRDGLADIIKGWEGLQARAGGGLEAEESDGESHQYVS